MTSKIAFAVCVFLMFACASFGYELIMKNGKVIRGKLLSENNELFVIEDDSGVKMNFKKSNVDLEKTAAANKVEQPAPKADAAEPAEPKKVEAPVKPKKPSRVFTEQDVRKLRGEYPMEEGSKEGNESNEKAGASGEKTEDYWKQTSQQMLSSMKEAEAAYQSLTASCQKLKGATIQTHRVYDSKTGETLDMKETTSDVCSQAETAKGAYEQAKSNYQGFMEEARQEVVPPGWLATNEEE